MQIKCSRNKMHKLHKIKEIIRENPKTISLILEGKIGCKPGQFIMLWLPSVDEKPFAVSKTEENRFRITIEEKGKFTKTIPKLEQGAEVGIRGPYGHGFEIKNNSIIAAGGLGMAPLVPLISRIKNSSIIQGAKSKKSLLYLEDKSLIKAIEENNNKIAYCTDDGSHGIKGFTTDLLKQIINKEVQTVYTCGPEIMINNVFKMCEENKVECQATLERYIRCGFGVCGACACGGQLVCKDGPVFNSSQLRKLGELGKFARLKSGRKVKIEEYYNWRNS